MAEDIIGSGSSREVASANLQELQETVSRLSSHAGVESVLILNRSGDIIAESSKRQNESSPETAASVSKLLKLATSYIQSLSPEDEVSFLQVRSNQRRELYISPYEGYVLALSKR